MKYLIASLCLLAATAFGQSTQQMFEGRTPVSSGTINLTNDRLLFWDASASYNSRTKNITPLTLREDMGLAPWAGLTPGTLATLNAAPAGTLTGTVLASGVVTSSLTAVGTITTGVWQGTRIAPAYLGTGTPDGTKFLRDDGAFVAIPGGGDALVANPLSQFAPTTSDQLAGVLTNESGTAGGFVRATGSAINLASATGLPLTSGVTGILPVANGGTGTATPALVAGTNITLTGTWPNVTINATGGGGGGGLAYTSIDLTSTTALSVATAYNAGSVSTSIDFDTLPVGANNDEIKILFRATTTVVFDFHTDNVASIRRVGETGTLAGDIYYPTGNHWINFRKSDGIWFMADSGSDLQGETPFIVAFSDETTVISAGTSKVTFRAPFPLTVLGVKASLNIASSSGLPSIDVKENGVSILSTPITIDESEKSSLTAITPPVVSDAAIADDAEITVDVNASGTGAVGGKLTIYYSR